MALGYMNSEDLLESIKLRAAVPMSQITYQDEDLLRFAQEEIELKIVPSVLAVKEEFYVTPVQLPLLPNTSNYDIPYRAIGNKVRSVFYRQSNDNLLRLAHIPIEHINEYQDTSYPAQASGFCLENDHIKMLPSIGANPQGSIEMRYYLRPNTVVMMARGAKITSIDRDTGVITVVNGSTGVSKVPTNININTQVDLIRARPINKTYKFDITLAAVNAAGGSVTLALDDIPEDLVVGDWVCTAGETVIPQIPPELHVMLAQAVACRVLESLTDTQALTNATTKLQEMEMKLLNVIDTRVESPFRKVVSQSTTFLSNRRNRRRYY